jgi:hypothetical protein
MGRALLVLESPQDRQKAISWINKAPVGTRVEFKASKRSLPQNDRLWAMLTDVREHMKAKGLDYTTDQFKVIFLHAWGKEVEFLPGLDGKTFVPYGQSSSDLSKEEMTSFIEFIIAWGAENGVTFHEPNTETSDAGGNHASGDNSADPSPGAVEEGPAGVSPAPAGSEEPSLFGKWNYQGQDLTNLREFSKKAIGDARKAGELPAKLQFLEMMSLNYLDAMESDDGRKALNSMTKAVELVMKGDRDVDRIEAWMQTEFLTEAKND